MCSKSTLDAIKDSTGHLRAAIMAVTEPARQQVLHHQGQAAPREDADGRKKTGPEGPVCMQCRDRSAHDALAITALGRVRLGSALAEGRTALAAAEAATGFATAKAARLAGCTTEAAFAGSAVTAIAATRSARSEEHTSELQSPCNLVC